MKKKNGYQSLGKVAFLTIQTGILMFDLGRHFLLKTKKPSKPVEKLQTSFPRSCH